MVSSLLTLLLSVLLFTIYDGVRTPSVWSLVLDIICVLVVCVFTTLQYLNYLRAKIAAPIVVTKRICFTSRLVLNTSSYTNFDMKIKISEDGTNANCRFGFDSCANIHYVGDRRLLHNYRTQSGVTIDGIGGCARVVGVGDLHLTLRSDDGSYVSCIVPDVFHVEGDYANILSMLLFKKQCKQAVKRVVIDDESSGSYFRLSNNSRVNLGKLISVSKRGPFIAPLY